MQQRFSAFSWLLSSPVLVTTGIVLLVLGATHLPTAFVSEKHTPQLAQSAFLEDLTPDPVPSSVVIKEDIYQLKEDVALIMLEQEAVEFASATLEPRRDPFAPLEPAATPLAQAQPEQPDLPDSFMSQSLPETTPGENLAVLSEARSDQS